MGTIGRRRALRPGTVPAAVCALALAAVSACGTESARHADPFPAPRAARAPQPPPSVTPKPVAASPYLYPWGDPPDPAEVMRATGVGSFAMAFLISDGTCNPAWGGERPLDGPQQDTIRAIRDAGGDVMPSIGGHGGPKLGLVCPNARALAGAYQRVIDAYELEAVEIDVEAEEFESQAAQDRILKALNIVQRDNPELRTVVTFPTAKDGPNWWGERLIRRGAELEAGVDVWTVLPFNFGGTDMVRDTVNATEALHRTVREAFGYGASEAYAHIGITSMNGRTNSDETVTVADFHEIADYAKDKGLGRLSFWAVNRDRPCPDVGAASSSCSGIDQRPWEFTGIVADFGG